VVTARTDSRAAVSLLAVERALDWYAEELRFSEKQPISASQAAALRAVMRGEQPLYKGQIEVLVTFAHTMFLVGQKVPEVPSCVLGDALTALSALGTNVSERWPWRWDPVLDAKTFTQLGFSQASAGIVSAQRANREGWRAHAKRNRAFIEEAAGGCAQKNLAVVLGAGQAFDLPLTELARDFARIVLVDIDGAALDATIAATFKDAGLRAKVEPRVLDLSGINGQLVRAVDRVFAGSAGAGEIAGELSQLCRSYWLSERPRLLGADEHADLLVSGLVLSQIAWPQRVYALRLYEQRFGKLQGEEERRWVVPWWEFELRVQQDHITSLAGGADRIVLCSDVISRSTLLDAAGKERETGQKTFAIGVASLLERVPKSFRIEQHAAWQWQRYGASKRGAPGSRMDVEGVLLSEPDVPGDRSVPDGAV
jgi:hypothetical protein